jgi:serine/threonine protein kinase
LAVFHRRRFGLELEGYLITEKLERATDLHAYLGSLDDLAPTERMVAFRQRIDEVARLVCEFHRRQLSHRDLKATNVLLTAEAVWLIDLVGVRVYRRLAKSRRIQNLARLHASFCRDKRLTRADKLRFLRVYLQWGIFGQAGWKDWWRALDLATRAKVLRNERRGRPLT